MSSEHHVSPSLPIKLRRSAPLDALRMIAALLVVLYHIGPTFPLSAYLSRAYLSVDFFFMLSGFVVTGAYHVRMTKGLNFKSFMLIRLYRLYPLIIFGVLMSAVVEMLSGSSLTSIALALFIQLFFVPLLVGTTSAYVLNGVQWSLTFELLANASHRLIQPCMSRTRLFWLIALSGLAELYAAHHFGNLVIGHTAKTFFWGLVRVAFPYVTGASMCLLHQQYGRVFRRGFFAVILTLPLAILGSSLVHTWWVDPFIVMAIFPLVLWFGASTTCPSRVSKLAVAGGALSYALYAVHIPTLNAVWLYAGSSSKQSPLLWSGIAFAATLLSATLSIWLIDNPIQRWLKHGRGRVA